MGCGFGVSLGDCGGIDLVGMWVCINRDGYLETVGRWP